MMPNTGKNSFPSRPAPNRVCYSIFCLAVVLLAGNLNALMDLVLHPDIPYFDKEHIIVGGTFAFFTIIAFRVLSVYLARLAGNEEKLHTITNTAQDAIVMMDDKGAISFWNPAAERVFGYESSEAIGRELHSFLSPGRYYEAYKQSFEGFRKDGRGMAVGKTLELAAIRKGGEEFPIELSLSAIEISDKWHAVGVIRDVTDRKRAEEALRESEERYRSVVDNVGIGIALISPKMEILSLNRQMQEWSPAIDASSRPICFRSFNRPPREEICSYCPTVKTLEDGLVHESVTETPVEGGIINFRVISSPLKDSEGNVTAAIELVEDITERKRASDEIKRLNDQLELKVEERTRQLIDAQEELVRKEKLAILGQLAGTVGHELRNPLGVMNNAVYFLKSVQPDASETVKEYLDIIKNEVDNSKRIIQDLLDFSRTKPPQKKPTGVDELVRPSLGKCEISENIVVATDIQDSLPLLNVDPFQMRQVFQNLITNAVQAMPRGGELRISARLVQSSVFNVQSFEEQDKGPGTLNVEPSPGESVEISISDTGEGIAPENMRRLFQPLFTTKSKGIGLGLVVSRNLITANGGRIEAESRSGGGTTFKVTLPAERK